MGANILRFIGVYRLRTATVPQTNWRVNQAGAAAPACPTNPAAPRAARRSAVGPGVPDRPTLPRVARRGAWVSRGGLALCTVLMAAVPRMQSSPSSLWVVVGHIIVSVWSQRRPCAAPLARGAFPPAPRGRGAVIDLTHRLSQR